MPVEIAASPVQHLQSSLLDQAGVTLYVKRDDLIHPHFGGNKWRKLKYNLIQAKQQGYNTLLTFGGAWSNHIYATAAAGQAYGFNTIGFIRGEKHTPLNTTLSFAESCGMQLHYINRQQYKNKNDNTYLQTLKQKFGDVYILPEGGSNALALKGCEEIVTEINHQLTVFDTICCASGTGATLAGLITAIEPQQTAVGFSALKGGFLTDDVETLLKRSNAIKQASPQVNWHVEDRFHFGGYAKIDNTLIHFMQAFKSDYGFELDAVYTAKMFYGLFQLIEAGTFKAGSTIVAIHSGGLQGNKGFNLYPE